MTSMYVRKKPYEKGGAYAMMHSLGCQKAAGALLLVGGLVHLIPQLSMWLTDLTGGTPWIQIVVGAVSVIVVVGHWMGLCKNCKKG